MSLGVRVVSQRGTKMRKGERTNKLPTIVLILALSLSQFSWSLTHLTAPTPKNNKANESSGSCQIPQDKQSISQQDCKTDKEPEHSPSKCHECAGVHCHDNHLTGKKTSQFIFGPSTVAIFLKSSEGLPPENNSLDSPYRPPASF